jgi:putative transposase
MSKQSLCHLTKSERIGQFRLKIIGGLLASPPEKGDLKNQLEQLAKKPWLHPLSGETVHYSIPTLERWYYKSKNENKNQLHALGTVRRNDNGIFKSLRQRVCDALKQQYAEHDGWSVQLHYDNLLVRIEDDNLQAPPPSYSSVLRYMRANGLHRKSKRRGPHSPGAQKAAKRYEQREVRSFEIDYVNGLWHLDFHHGSLKVLNDKGEWVKPLLLAIMDDNARLVCHMQWYYSEDAECLVHGFCQALQKRALPRSLVTDNGSAMLSGEFTRGLHELNIVHHKTLPYSPYQNGKQETFWANVEGRLLAMLENKKDLTLRLLNQATQAWVEGDYHQKKNEALKGQTPIDCYLQHHDVGRACPDSESLRSAFRRQVKRTQRRSDGTVSLEGKRFEVPDAYRDLKVITIRYASWDLATIHLVDPETSSILAPLYPQNKSANADGLRKLRHAASQLKSQQQCLSFNETSPYLKKLMNEYAATGLPQGYIPKDEVGEHE